MAKLYSFADGILRTHITWEDLQEKAKEIWGEKAVFGANKSASSIGDGRGFMSKMCLIDPDWLEETGAPKKFIAKISSQISLMEAGEKIKEINPPTPEMEQKGMEMMEAMSNSVRCLHNTEVNVYNLIEKYSIDVPHPKVFAKVPFTEENQLKGYLIMEYIDNALSLNLYDNINVEDIKPALRGIAALEAVSLQFTEEEQAKLTRSPLKELIEAIMNPATLAQTVNQVRQFAGHVVGEQLDKFEALSSEMLDMDAFSQIGLELGMKKVFVHGDLWSTNFLWAKKDGTNNLNLAAIIDYQTCTFGMPATDIFRALASCLSGKDRQEHWEELVEYFYEQLLKCLDGNETPYTLEQLKESYRRFIPLGGCMLVPMIGPIFQLNQIIADPESRKKTNELVLEKVECLLDDMLKQHEKNISRKKEAN